MGKRVIFSALSALFAAALLCACAGAPAAGSAESAGPEPVPVRQGVDDYSWEELSSIADEIASAEDDGSALATAKRYHLTADDGTLDGTQAKTVELADGVTTQVLVAGFNHDDLAGGGRAGITFVFADAVAMHRMNNDVGPASLAQEDGHDAAGGWNASEMRGWLNGEFVDDLPADLRASLADVAKSSLAVTGLEADEYDDTGTVLTSTDNVIGEGVDKLWVPSLVELSGVKEGSETAKAYPEWTAALKAEGRQYQLFSDSEVSESRPNGVLVRSLAGDDAAQRWWLRSLESVSFSEVLADGSIDRRDQVPAASTALGVVPCFAI